jgi:hypothetical protein
MKTQRYHDQKLRNSAERIVQLLRDLFERRLTLYLRSIVRNVFGNFLETRGGCRICLPETPLYLLSYVCCPGSYKYSSKIHPSSKKSTPNGLTEEYLLRFRKHSHHNGSGLFDTLQEYWYDWGAFGGPIFSHQDVFLWDCTEACGTAANNSSQVKCNECSIAKHVFAFPFDSWSLIHARVLRDRRCYASRGRMSDQAWQQNRTSVLLALEALNKVALGMAKTTSFRVSCKWINLEPSVIHSRSTVPQRYPIERRMYMQDRVKLGEFIAHSHGATITRKASIMTALWRLGQTLSVMTRLRFTSASATTVPMYLRIFLKNLSRGQECEAGRASGYFLQVSQLEI